MEIVKDWTGKSILIVEDDKFIAYIIEGFLKKTNAKLFVATTGEEAVKIALDVKPNLILMDIKLPGMSGFTATKMIKENLSDTIIIAQTAFVSDSDRINALESGCTDFLPKPILREKLINLLGSFLDKI